jgi:phosphate transport system permease protein
MRKKDIEELIFLVLMKLSTFFILGILLLIIASIFYYGLPSLTWEMVSSTPKGGYYFGQEGGVLNAIIGSLYLGLGASFLAFIMGMPLALYLNIHLKKKKKTANFIRFVLDILLGIPSIVYGAFGFTIMISIGIGASLLAGIITVTLFILPIMIRAIDEVLKSVPERLLEASYSLGSLKFESAYKVYFKQCLPGITTAILLSFGRAIGDVAAVLFTTGYSDNITTSLDQQTATLPLAIFFQLSSPIPEVKERAYASAAILTVIILIISVLSRYISNKHKKNIIK